MSLGWHVSHASVLCTLMSNSPQFQRLDDSCDNKLRDCAIHCGCLLVLVSQATTQEFSTI